MKRIVQGLSIWMFLFLAGCQEDHGYRVGSYQELKIEDVPDDIKIPGKAWNLLEFKAVSEGHEAAPSAVASSQNFIFSEVALYIVQKNEGVVKGEALKFSFPRGGGTLDLAPYIGQQKGSFYVGFDFPQMEEATATKVIFMSRARKRKLGGQIFGAGCNQFFDITKTFTKAMKLDGLKVNTTQERYLSVLGGTFLFAAQKGSDIYLSQITIVNSKHPQYFCEGR